MLECPIRLSTPKEEGVLQVSKWLKFPVLLDTDEMKSLIEEMRPFFICIVSHPVLKEKGIVAKQEFLEKYSSYIDSLKKGELYDESQLRPYFSSIFTHELDSLYAIAVGTDKVLIKSLQPVIQLQAHHFFYSTLDKKFHAMALSNESVSWGIQFSYPQVAEDPKTRQILKVNDQSLFPNSALFVKMQRWLRENTLPTPFIAEGKRTNSPIRIGKKCLSWIDSHPQLKAKDIKVAT